MTWKRLTYSKQWQRKANRALRTLSQCYRGFTAVLCDICSPLDLAQAKPLLEYHYHRIWDSIEHKRHLNTHMSKTLSVFPPKDLLVKWCRFDEDLISPFGKYHGRIDVLKKIVLDKTIKSKFLISPWFRSWYNKTGHPYIREMGKWS